MFVSGTILYQVSNIKSHYVNNLDILYSLWAVSDLLPSHLMIFHLPHPFLLLWSHPLLLSLAIPPTCFCYLFLQNTFTTVRTVQYQISPYYPCIIPSYSPYPSPAYPYLSPAFAAPSTYSTSLTKSHPTSPVPSHPIILSQSHPILQYFSSSPVFPTTFSYIPIPSYCTVFQLSNPFLLFLCTIPPTVLYFPCSIPSCFPLSQPKPLSASIFSLHFLTCEVLQRRLSTFFHSFSTSDPLGCFIFFEEPMLG